MTLFIVCLVLSTLRMLLKLFVKDERGKWSTNPCHSIMSKPIQSCKSATSYTLTSQANAKGLQSIHAALLMHLFLCSDMKY